MKALNLTDEECALIVAALRITAGANGTWDPTDTLKNLAVKIEDWPKATMQESLREPTHMDLSNCSICPDCMGRKKHWFGDKNTGFEEKCPTCKGCGLVSP